MKRSLSTTLLLVLGCAVIVAQEVPKADLFFGYSFVRANSARSIPAFTMNGGLGTFGYNFNNHIGLEAEIGGYHNGNINGIMFDTTIMPYLFGPRFSYGRSKKFDPYVHFLFGATHLTTSVPVTLTPTPTSTATETTTRLKAAQDNFTMAIGGGIDLKLNKAVTLRPIQFDYFMTRLEDFGQLGPSQNRNQHNLRYAAGLMFTFGGEKAAPPPPPRPTTRACPGGINVPIDQDCPRKDFGLGIKVDKNDVCAGTVVMVAPGISLPEGAAQEWTVNGESISRAPQFEFGTTGRPAGSYRIGLKVAGEGYNDASAETVVTVRGYQPPSGTLQASPAEIWAGDKATLVPNFRAGECGGTLRPATLAASEGSISGNEFDSSSVRFDPSNTSEQQKTITIAANVSDEKGSASARTDIVVKKKAGAKRFSDILFAVGSARVNNCGKRVLLEELKTYTSSDPTGQVVLVGHQSAGESKWPDLDQKRALNAAAVISAGQGICTSFPANQIQVGATGATENGVDYQPHFCGASAGPERPGQTVQESDDTAKYRRVEVWFIPTGTSLPPSLKDAKDAATLSVSALGCPR